MTDKYGSVEGQESGTEQEPSAEPEAWQGNQPPVDDFTDPDHAGTEGAATVSEETEAEAVEAAADEAPVAKKSSMLPAAIGALGVLFVVGMAYFQFFSSSLAPRPAPVVTHKSVPAPAAPVDLSAPAASAALPAPIAAPAPSMVSNDVTSLKLPPEAPSPAPMPSASIPSDVAMPSTPSSSPAASLQPPSAAPVTPPETAPSAAMEAQFNALSMRMDVLQKTMGDTAQHVDQLNGTVAALQASAAVAATNPPALEERLAKLEQDVLRLEQTSAMAKAAKTASAARASQTSITSPASLNIAPAPHHTKPRRIAAPPKVTPPPAVKPAAPASTSWVLRAATPGEAWVSQSAGSSDLKHVQVGDELAGLGRISAIRQDNGKWTIETAKGNIQ